MPNQKPKAVVTLSGTITYENHTETWPKRAGLYILTYMIILVVSCPQPEWLCAFKCQSIKHDNA